MGTRIVIAIAALLLLAGCGGGKEERALSSEALAGGVLFAESGCLTCHTYAGLGHRNLGGPDLTHEAEKDRGVSWQVRHLKCPSCLVPNSPMVPYVRVAEEDLRRMAIFLEASR